MKNISKREKREMYLDWLCRRPEIIFAFPEVLTEEASYSAMEAGLMQDAWKAAVNGMKESGLLGPRTKWQDFDLLKYIPDAQKKWAYRKKGFEEGWL